jgi:DNA/RNA-binding domain of Phe-tRNA-synthetase-like protein
MLVMTDAWLSTYPEAAVGLLLMQEVDNPSHHAGLEAEKAAVEEQLRASLAGANRTTLKELPTIQAYEAYYKRFKKSYHVLLQLESVALKGKNLPSVAALVEAMFMAELKNQLLTAGHDFALIQEPIRIDVAEGDESYVRLNGQEQRLKAGDMFIADSQGILSSIIYGPDRRSRINPATGQVIFTVYAPPGISRPQLLAHLRDIQANVLLVSPAARTAVLDVYGNPTDG